MMAFSTELPPNSRIADSFARPWFRDVHRAPLAVRHGAMPGLFFAIFGHHPSWMKNALIARNRIAARCGLAVPADDEILTPLVQPHYAVGDRIGPWPIFHLSKDEIIAGRDNRHLDFRVSVLRRWDGTDGSVAVTTVCKPHHMGGKAYLALVAPFHVFGVRWLLAGAVKAGRI